MQSETDEAKKLLKLAERKLKPFVNSTYLRGASLSIASEMANQLAYHAGNIHIQRDWETVKEIIDKTQL